MNAAMGLSLTREKPTHRVWILRRGSEEEVPFYCVARDDEHALDIAAAQYPDDLAEDVERIE